MALLQCHECGSQVSSSATACPQCGAPPSVAETTTGVAVTTTQATSKRLKSHLLVGVLFAIVGVIWVTAALQASSAEIGAAPDGQGTVIGSLLTLFGLMLVIVAKFRMWWHHG